MCTVGRGMGYEHRQTDRQTDRGREIVAENSVALQGCWI